MDTHGHQSGLCGEGGSSARAGEASGIDLATLSADAARVGNWIFNRSTWTNPNSGATNQRPAVGQCSGIGEGLRPAREGKSDRVSYA